MKLLLDTHILLWLVSESERLPKPLAARLALPETVLYFSSASAWEITIKYGLGRIELDSEPPAFFDGIIEQFNLVPLPISIAHAATVAQLPRHHNDPFDRLLVAQSIVEKVPLVTLDSQVRKYPTKFIR